MRIIRAACEHRLTIASHVHRPEQLMFADRYHIPCVALFREPLESVASLVVRDDRYRIESSIRHYQSFCEAALAIDSPRFLILEFTDVIRAPSAYAEGVLNQFGIDHLPVDEELVARATRDDRSDKTMSSLPNPEKDALKAKVYEEVRSDPGFARSVKLFEQAIARKWAAPGGE